MSDKKNHGIQDYAMYDTMTTEELEDILRLDAQNTEGKGSDVEKLLYVMGVLADRNRTNNTGKTAQQAWESFQRNYLSEEEGDSPDTLRQKSGKSSTRWLRRMIAAAAVLVVVVGIPLTVHAIGWEKICGLFAKWSKGTFFFVDSADVQVSEPISEYHGNCGQLQELLENSNIDAGLVPTWIPERYELDKVERDIDPVQVTCMALYRSADKYLRIYVRSYLQGDPDKVEVNGDILEIYEVSGVQYYIFSNMEQIRAIWVVDSYQCNISGNVSLEEIKMMIDSIGEG